MYLMMNQAFESGYRRYEWKCNALNLKSRYAAQRLGLSYEGVFRQMTINKGRNRNTAWFAAIDKEWSSLKQSFETYLSYDNFDENQQPKSFGVSKLGKFWMKIWGYQLKRSGKMLLITHYHGLFEFFHNKPRNDRFQVPSNRDFSSARGSPELEG